MKFKAIVEIDRENFIDCYDCLNVLQDVLDSVLNQDQFEDSFTKQS